MPGYKSSWTGTLANSDILDYLQKQSVMKFATSSARDTALSGVLRDGMMAYTDDDGMVWLYSAHDIASAQWIRFSSVWEGWLTTPSFSAGVTEGDGTFDVVCRYERGSLRIRGQFTLGSTSAVTGVPQFDISAYLTSTATHFSGGMAAVRDTSAARWYTASSIVGIGGDDIVIQTDGATIDGSTPFTWASGDFICWDILVTHPDLDDQ